MRCALVLFSFAALVGIFRVQVSGAPGSTVLPSHSSRANLAGILKTQIVVVVPDLVTGLLPIHQTFAPFRDSFNGQRTFRDGGIFGEGFDASTESVQLTTTDRGVDGHSVAAVGSVDNPEDLESRKAMQVHNVDVAAGGCAFNWATFSLEKVFEPSSSAGPEPGIETGEVTEQWFSPGGQPGDWRTWEVPFSGRFAMTPVVLLTPHLCA